MNKTILFLSAFLSALFLFSVCTLSAQDAGEADNPGMASLNQATEAKLQAGGISDLAKVIMLCQKAKKEGLSGENLKYCNQLLASSQLQRGMFFAQSLLNHADSLPSAWEEIRTRALDDLEAAVLIITDQPMPYLRIAQLHALPNGNEGRCKSALALAEQYAKDEPGIRIQAVKMRATLETDPAKREAILAAASKDENPQLLLLHAVTLLDLKRNDDAIKVLQKLLETEPDNADLLGNAFALLADHGEFESALKILDSLKGKVSPDKQDEITMQKAKILAQMNKFAEVIPLLEELRKKHPDELKILLFRSDIYLEMHEYDKALRDVDAALRLRPGFPMSLRQKTKILIAQDKFDDALAIAEELITLDPEEDSFALVKLQVLLLLKKYDDAAALVQELRKKQPEEAKWASILIDIYIEKEDFSKAIALIQEQRKANPDVEIWTLRLIQIYTIQKKPDEAVKVADGMIAKYPDEERWLLIKAQLLSDQKKYDAAVKVLEPLVKTNPEKKDITLALISVLAEMKNYKSALAYLKPLLEKEPGNVPLLHIKSSIAISTGLHPEAVKALDAILKAEPNNYSAMNNLAWLLSTSPLDVLRDGERALELAEKASKLTDYKEAYILSTLAAAYAETRNFEKALEWSQKSIDITKEKDDKETDKELLENLQKELDSYKQKLPFREVLDEGKK
ncbi:hypothetical protein FACS1894189_2190 [Planctomycetales bacterium]|nr:hypothetical protein FACS1894189_2190 [Planctomycetales bacterium]